MGPRPHVVVIGAGFGGLSAVRHLRQGPFEITVVDRANYHGFWPLLYQVATAGLGPDDIARPIRAVLDASPNVRVRIGTVSRVDVARRAVELTDGDTLTYDFLILAAGSSSNDFGIRGVAEHAFALKTLADAVRLRNHILKMFEHADAHPDPLDEGRLTFLLVGGGPTGVELAGALSELIGRNLARDFPHLDVSRARIVLVEMAPHLLGTFSEVSQRIALTDLDRVGVEVRLGTAIKEVSPKGAVLANDEILAAATVVWTAGVKASPLSQTIASERDANGTLMVRGDLSLPRHPEVFVVGDLASSAGRDGRPHPMLAQVAIQGGRRAAANVRRLHGGRRTRQFRYRNHGIMATIGRRSAVAELPGGIHLSGSPGWACWLGVHLVFLVGFRNRAVVLLNWAWNYLTWERASRVILEEAREGR